MVGDFALCLILWMLNTCTPKVTRPSVILHSSYPKSVLLCFVLFYIVLFSVGCLHCLQRWCLFSATSGCFPTGRLQLTESPMFSTKELYTGRAGSPLFDINLGQKAVVSQTPERLFPQRMITSFSSDASYEAA